MITTISPPTRRRGAHTKRGYAANTDRTYTTDGAPLPPASAFTNGVVTPHASFLALPYAPGEAVANLRALDRDFGAYHEGLGFRDSVNVRTGRVSDYMLALDQGMIAAALAQAIRPGAAPTALPDGWVPVEGAFAARQGAVLHLTRGGVRQGPFRGQFHPSRYAAQSPSRAAKST